MSMSPCVVCRCTWYSAGPGRLMAGSLGVRRSAGLGLEFGVICDGVHAKSGTRSRRNRSRRVIAEWYRALPPFAAQTTGRLSIGRERKPWMEGDPLPRFQPDLTVL